MQAVDWDTAYYAIEEAEKAIREEQLQMVQEMER